MAAYLAGSLTRDHGDKPDPDSNIVRWNSNPAFCMNEKRERDKKRIEMSTFSVACLRASKIGWIYY